MTKQELRNSIREQKKLYWEMFPAWSQDACQKIRQMDCWQRAHTVLLYHALPDEPELQSLLDSALSDGKQVLLPVVVKDDLLVKNYNGADCLHEGAFHILEPMGADFPLTRYGEIDLALIPGVAFDREGHRLGRGRGYYDHLLPRIPQALKLGVCFPFQFVDAVPAESHDTPVDAVVLPVATSVSACGDVQPATGCCS